MYASLKGQFLLKEKDLKQKLEDLRAENLKISSEGKESNFKAHIAINKISTESEQAGLR